MQIQTSGFMVDFLFGGLSAAITKTLNAPIERIQVLLQTQDVHPLVKSGKAPRYTGIRDCMTRVCKQEGAMSLWRGNLSNVLRYFPAQAFNFAFKDRFRLYFCPFDSKKNPWKFFFGNLISGGLAGALSQFIIYPLDFVRTRLAADIMDASKDAKHKRQFKGSAHCLLKIYHSEGIPGVYAGVWLSAALYFFYRAIYFGGYDTINQLWELQERKSSLLLRMAVALSVTNIAGFIVFPLDTVRRRIMMQAGQMKQKLYTGTADCIRKIWQAEGKSGFYKGGLTNVLRGSGSSLTLIFYDDLQRNWRKKATKGQF